jgi:hypothetical protein
MRKFIATISIIALMCLPLPAQNSVGSHRFIPASSGGCTTSSIQAIYDADSLSASPVTTNWLDGTSNHYDMTPTASPTWAASQVNGHAAVTLNGSTQYFSRGPSIPISTNISVYAVVKVASLTNESGLASAQGGSTFFPYINASSGLLGADYQNIANIGNATSQALSAGTWYVVTWTYNQSSGVLTMYVNGTSAGTATQAESITLGINTLFTKATLDSFFDGQTSLVVITNAAYDATFNACEVTRYAL